MRLNRIMVQIPFKFVTTAETQCLTFVSVSDTRPLDSLNEGHRREVGPAVGARTVPAGGVTTRSRAARASCPPALGPAREVRRCKWVWRWRVANPQRVAPSPMKPGPWPRLGDGTFSSAGTVVERRQASAPTADGSAQAGLDPWRAAVPAGTASETLRLSAFRFLRFLFHLSPPRGKREKFAVRASASVGSSLPDLIRQSMRGVDVCKLPHRNFSPHFRMDHRVKPGGDETQNGGAGVSPRGAEAARLTVARGRYRRRASW